MSINFLIRITIFQVVVYGLFYIVFYEAKQIVLTFFCISLTTMLIRFYKSKMKRDYKTTIRYGITHVEDNTKLRRVTIGMTGRGLFATKAEAEAYLNTMNTPNGLHRVLSESEIKTLKIAAIECYENGDPTRFYICSRNINQPTKTTTMKQDKILIGMQVSFDLADLAANIAEQLDEKQLAEFIVMLDMEFADWGLTTRLIRHFNAVQNEPEAIEFNIDTSPCKIEV